VPVVLRGTQLVRCTDIYGNVDRRILSTIAQFLKEFFAKALKSNPLIKINFPRDCNPVRTVPLLRFKKQLTFGGHSSFKFTVCIIEHYQINPNR
jgi:hypothetical protein